VNSSLPDPRAEQELRLAGRFPGSLGARNTPGALMQLSALHELRELAADSEPEADL
jgi:hypothetical protein